MATVDACRGLDAMIKDEVDAQPAYDNLKRDLVFRGGLTPAQAVDVELVIDANTMDEHKHEVMLKKLKDLICK